MKNLLAILVVISMATVSCTKSDESLQSNQSEIESRRPKGGGGGGVISTNVPQVTGLTATVSSPTSVNLAWNSVAGATSYWIYRNNAVLAIWTSASFIDKTVSSGSTYTYAVAAVVNSTLGPKSTSVTVTTP